MDQLLSGIRSAEAASHTEAYTRHELFTSGSWLARPVKTVMELLPLYQDYSTFCGLDLGCGVGRNSIPIAQAFDHIPCRVDCVDILDLAIEKLRENARKYQVEHSIHGIVSAIDDFEIPQKHYDLILAVSALEHVDSRETFIRKLEQIRDGLRPGGIVCLIVNSGVSEKDKASNQQLTPQFEVNLDTQEIQCLLSGIFSGWEKVKHTVVHQKYDIPRTHCTAELETDVVTFVARNKEKEHG